MPIIEGLKHIQDGEFYLIRYSFVNGKKEEIARYKMFKYNKEITIKTLEKENISHKIRYIEIKKNDEVIMWINPSRFGLLYSITPLQ